MNDEASSRDGNRAQPYGSRQSWSVRREEQRARPGVLLMIIGGGAGTLVLLLVAFLYGGGHPNVAKVASKAGGNLPAAVAKPASVGSISSATLSPAAPAARSNAQAGSTRTSNGGDWKSVEEKWGIQITGLRMAMGGAAIDLRYKVTDADKATSLMKLTDGPYVIDHTSGKTLAVPFQKENQTQQKLVSGKSYFALLPNEGAAAKSGHKVTVAIGSTLQSDLTIE